MAAIDKLYLKDYYDFNEFRLWCLIHKPKLLNNFYMGLDISYKEWMEYKENLYLEELTSVTNFIDRFPTKQAFKERYADANVAEWDEMMVRLDYLNNHKKTWLRDRDLPVTNFPIKYDKYLLWHCPLPYIRDYLTKQCGYKTKWYHRLFWKE